jgi:hypothetical protein
MQSNLLNFVLEEEMSRWHKANNQEPEKKKRPGLAKRNGKTKDKANNKETETVHLS